MHGRCDEHGTECILLARTNAKELLPPDSLARTRRAPPGRKPALLLLLRRESGSEFDVIDSRDSRREPSCRVVVYKHEQRGMTVDLTN